MRVPNAPTGTAATKANLQTVGMTLERNRLPGDEQSAEATAANHGQRVQPL